MGKITVAPAPTGFSDWDELHGLLHTCFAYMADRIDPPSSLNRMTPDDLRSKAETETLVLAYDAGRLVGCAHLAARPDAIYIGKVAVLPAYQRRGILRRMMAIAEDLAREQGKQALELETRIELTENHATFRALGFAKSAEKAHAGYDRPTSITMRKPL